MINQDAEVQRLEQSRADAMNAYNLMLNKHNQIERVKVQKQQLETKIQQINTLIKGIEDQRDADPEYPHLQKVNEKLQEARTLLDSFQTEHFQEAPNEYINFVKFTDLENYAHGIRQLFARKKKLEAANQLLENERTNLEGEKDDLEQVELLGERQWMNENEDKLTSENQSVRREYQMALNEVLKNDSIYSETLNQLSKEKTQKEIKLFDLNLTSTQNNLQMETLEDDIRLKMRSTSSDCQQAINNMLDSITKLRQRSEQYNQIIDSSNCLNMANEQAQSFFDESNSLEKFYNERRQVLTKVEEELRDTNKDRYDSEQILAQDQENLKRYQAEIDMHNLWNQKILEELHRLEDINVDLQIIINRQKLTSKYGTSYHENQNKIKELKDNIAKIDAISQLYQNLIKDFTGEGREKLNTIIQQAKASPPPADKPAPYPEFQALINSTLPTVDNLHEQISSTLSEVKKETSNLTKQLDRCIDSLNRRLNPQGVKISETGLSKFKDPFCSGKEELADFDKSEAVYSKEDGEVSISVATYEALTKIIFNENVNSERNGFYPQLIMAFHNLKGKYPIDLVQSIMFLLNDYKQNPISGLTSKDIINSMHTLMSYWITMFPHDFTDQTMKAETLHMLEEMKTIENNIDDDVDASFVEEIQAINQFGSEIIEKPIPYENDETLLNRQAKSIPLLSDPRTMAYHFMYIHYKVFHGIQIQEYANCGWSQSTKEISSAHIVKLSTMFNDHVKLVIDTIIAEMKSKNKKEVIEAWIKIMKESEEIGEYLNIFIIDGAFSNPRVRNKLPYTWSTINKDLLQIMSNVCEITSPRMKFKLYRSSIAKRKPENTLPYIGPWQTEMTFINDGNKSTTTLPNSNEPAVNFEKQKAYFKPVADMMQPWGKKLKFKLSEEIIRRIENYDIVYKENAAILKAIEESDEEKKKQAAAKKK